MIKNIAVLITCFNRKTTTLRCLSSLFNQSTVSALNLNVYLVDDGSSDGTSAAVNELYPQVTIIQGNGKLYWAGGMRLAWETAKNKANFSAFLLINDDVILTKDFLKKLLRTHQFSIEKLGQGGIYVGTAVDPINFNFNYGGHLLIRKGLLINYTDVFPTDVPLPCHVTNANILCVCTEVVNKIGIFDPTFTHGIADYDYSLSAFEHKIPLWVVPGICGYCVDDHGNNWLSGNTSLKQRIEYLYSPKGLSFNEYMYYIKKHFPLLIPYLFIMLWLKTFFPSIWDKFKIGKGEKNHLTN